MQVAVVGFRSFMFTSDSLHNTTGLKTSACYTEATQGCHAIAWATALV